ncbi:hypothetical protein ACIBK9_28775 [Nonomuraea sp. NPDC050227]|uniref:hypothetical protein n=1 Tax=Nonomuraea sp. NPDC050227 TaxID=3364360 RepID=UPI00378D07E1
MLTEITASVAACVAVGDDVRSDWVRPYTPPRERELNQFLVLLKPELTAPGGTPATAALARVLGLLAEHRVQVGAVRVVSSGYLSTYRVVEHQYRMLNEVSRGGLPATSAAARDKLAVAYPYAAADARRVLGGHQFLQQCPEVSAFALDLLTRNVSVTKLGAGTYAIEILFDGERLVLLNPFHPQQLAHFTRPGQSIVLLECTSARPLRDLRREVIGATDPHDAVPGSIKRILLDEQDRLGLSGICTRQNAIHMSPGPVEGMVGLRRFFSTPDAEIAVGDTAFGAALLTKGHDAGAVAALSADPEVHLDGRVGPLFEVTEDMNWDEALEFTDHVLTRGMS